MKKVVLNWRYWLMGVIAMIAVILVIAVPDESNPHFFALLLASKALAFVFIYADYRLLLWFGKNRKINELIKYINNEL